MISKFQFKAVDELINAGVYNYVLIRQQVGLTSEELDEILNNYDYYATHFSQESSESTSKLKKKHWWNR